MGAIALALKILEMFIFVIIGFIAARAKVLKPGSAEVLSSLILYVLNPAMIIGAFQRDTSGHILLSLGAGFVLAFIIHIIYIGLSKVLEKTLHTNVVENSSAIYSNCGNLLLPIITSVVGPMGVLYSMPYIVVFNLLIWTHGLKMFRKDDSLPLYRLLLNVNLISIVVGLIFMLTGIRFSGIPLDIMDTLGSMLGPCAMIMTGIVIAGTDLTTLRSFKRMPIPIIMRMLLFPAIILGLFALTRIFQIFPDYRPLFITVFMAACAPAANTVTQFSVMYLPKEQAEYAGAINIITTLSCLATMPLFFYLTDFL